MTIVKAFAGIVMAPLFFVLSVFICIVFYKAKLPIALHLALTQMVVGILFGFITMNLTWKLFNKINIVALSIWVPLMIVAMFATTDDGTSTHGFGTVIYDATDVALGLGAVLVFWLSGSLVRWLSATDNTTAQETG